MAPHSSTLAWKIPWTEEPGGLQSMGSLRVGHSCATSLSLFTFMHWRRMAAHSSVLAWRIPGTGEPGGLPSMGSHRVGHDWSDLAAPAVQLICSVVSDSLCPHGLQHTRPHCSSPTPRVYPNSCPLSRWCHPTISSSVIPFSCLQSFPASGSFPVSQFFASGGQSKY